MQKLGMADFWRVILAKFWSRCCKRNLACFSFCKGHQVEMQSEKRSWVFHFARIEFSWVFNRFFTFHFFEALFCILQGARCHFSICWLQNATSSPTLVIFEGIFFVYVCWLVFGGHLYVCLFICSFVRSCFRLLRARAAWLLACLLAYFPAGWIVCYCVFFDLGKAVSRRKISFATPLFRSVFFSSPLFWGGKNP